MPDGIQVRRRPPRAAGSKQFPCNQRASMSDSMITTSGHKSIPAIGFLTIVRDEEHGLFGGYLVLNPLGRPLEFHCTAPVKPNRAQEILYGPTLDAYLYGERIGPALLEKAKAGPRFVLTDVAQVMAARPFTGLPLLLMLPETSAPPETPPIKGPTDPAAPRIPLSHDRSAPSPATPDTLHSFLLGGYRLAADPRHAQDESVLSECWAQLEGSVDLREPFGRIRDAIDEARRGAGA